MLAWDLLGKAIGGKLPTGAIPVVSGKFSEVTFNKLRQMLTALAISSNCEMCHIVGYTPEARSIDDALRCIDAAVSGTWEDRYRSKK